MGLISERGVFLDVEAVHQFTVVVVKISVLTMVFCGWKELGRRRRHQGKNKSIYIMSRE